MSFSSSTNLTSPGTNWIQYLSFDQDKKIGYTLYDTGVALPNYIFSGSVYSADLASTIVPAYMPPQIPLSPNPGTLPSYQSVLIDYLLSGGNSVFGYPDVKYRVSFSDVANIDFNKEQNGQIFIFNADLADTVNETLGLAHKPINPPNLNHISYFNADGVNSTFLVDDIYRQSSGYEVEVRLNGIVLDKTAYTFSNIAITLVTIPNSGDKVEIYSHSAILGDIIIDNDLRHSLALQNIPANSGELYSGQKGAWVIMHELGHALGLSHAEDSGYSPSEENQKFTIMADLSSDTHPDMAGVLATGLQLYDIASLQELYGRNYSVRSEDGTVYKAGNVDGNIQAFGVNPTDAFIYTIWDGGGENDAIDTSMYFDAVEIDLRQGHFSSIGKNGNGGAVTHDVEVSGHIEDHGNLAVAYHTVIENAIGTSSGDTLIGNWSSNTLEGGAGDDTIFGDGFVYDGDQAIIPANSISATDKLNPNLHLQSSDNDYLIGGTGNDVIYGGRGNDYFMAGDIFNSTYGWLIENDLYHGGGYEKGVLSTKGGVIPLSQDGFDTVDYSQTNTALYAKISADIKVWKSLGENASYTDASAHNFLRSIDEVVFSKLNDIVKLESGPSSGDAKVFDGGLGLNTLILQDGFQVSSYWDYNTSRLYNLDGTGFFEFKNFTNTEGGFLGPFPATYLINFQVPNYDLTRESLYDFKNTGGDFSGAKVAATFSFTDINYSQEPDKAVLDGVTINIAGAAISSQFAYSYSNAIYTIASAGGGLSYRFAGTNHGDIFSTERGGVLSGGTGDDTFYLKRSYGTLPGVPLLAGTNDSIQKLAEDYNGAWVEYRGGTDNIYGGVAQEWEDKNIGFWGTQVWHGGGLKGLLMTDGITREDVSITFTDLKTNTHGGFTSDVTVTVDGLGTITVNDLWQTAPGGTLGPASIYIVFKNGDTLHKFSNGSEVFTASGQQQTEYRGLAADDVLVANGAASSGVKIYAYGGNDTVIGAQAADTLYGGDGDDIIEGKEGDDTVSGNDGTNKFVFNDDYGDDTITDYNRDNNDLIKFGDNTLTPQMLAGSRVGDDLHLATQNGSVSLAGFLAAMSEGELRAVLVEIEGLGTFELSVNSEGAIVSIDNIDLSLISGPTNGDDILSGTTGADVIDALNGNDTVYGLAGNDTLIGGRGNDTLDGGNDDDTLTGGEGDDTYYYAAGGDTISEATDSSGNLDQILLAPGIDVGDLGFSRSGDSLIISVAGGGTITIQNQFAHGSMVEQILFDNDDIFDLTLLTAPVTGTTAADSLTGRDIVTNFEADTLQGLSGNDTLSGLNGDDTMDGGIGADTMIGGVGDDTYIVDNASDVVSENSGEGSDTVYSSLSLTLGNYVENLVLTGTGALNATGNSLANILTGNDANNTLSGQTGADTMIGGLGNDTYIVDDSGDVVSEGAAAGTDNVQSSVSYTISSNVENLTLTGSGNINATGNGGDNTITGNAGDNTLDGGAGSDHLIGGDGEDVYVVNSGMNTILDSEGNDSITFGPGLDLADMALERVNETDLQISFDAVPYVLIRDFYITGKGIETLYFNDTSTFDLSAYHNITGTSSAETLTGLDEALLADDVIYALAGNDTLDGGAGNDYLVGGTGDDVYIYNGGIDVIREESGSDKIVFSAGFDAVDITLVRNGSDLEIYFSSVLSVIVREQFTANGKVETLEFDDMSTISVSAYSFTSDGSSGDDIITGITDGGSQDDVILGYAGNDTIDGADGNDTLEGGSNDDRIIGGTGDDVFIYTSGLDIYSDTSGSDEIRFGAGYDEVDMVLTRVNGNDLKISFDSVDVVIIKDHFVSGNGIETIRFDDNSTFDLTTIRASYTGTSGDDYLSGTNSADVVDVMSGLAGDDIIYGYAGDDIITGGSGWDRMYGGTGNDTYMFSPGFGGFTMDQVRENIGEGTDTIHIGGGLTPGDVSIWTDSSGDLHIQLDADSADHLRALSSGSSGASDIYSYVEYITFDDGTVFNLTDGLELWGTDGDETMRLGSNGDTVDGGAGSDTIYGYGGNDTITGGDGKDRIYGGTGDDTYVLKTGFGHYSGVDEIFENTSEGTDTIHIGDGLTRADVSIWTDASGDLHIQFIADADDHVKVYSAGTSGATDIGSRIEYITFDDGTILSLADGLDLSGTSGDETMRASSSADIINGGAGTDTLYGYGGRDTLIGGDGKDRMYGGTGDDLYKLGVGFGHYSGVDEIFEETSEGTDTIHIGDGLTREDVSIWTDETGNLHIQFVADADDHVKAYSSGTTGASDIGSRIEYITFDDGTILNQSDGLELWGTSSDETMRLSANADTVDGGAGTDTIYGYGGNDTIIGGDGKDRIYGGTGDDVFILNPGFGHYSGLDEIIEETSEGSDTIHIGGGLTTDDVSIITDETGNLIIRFNADADDHAKATSAGSYSASDIGSRVEFIRFDDGTLIDLSNGLDLWGSAGDEVARASDNADIVDGRAGADTLYGYGGNDTLIGGEGRDRLYGGTGDDTYIFKAGFGHSSGYDEIFEYSSEGIDTIYFEGISQNEIRMWTEYGYTYIQYTPNAYDQVRYYGEIERIIFGSPDDIEDSTDGIVMIDTDDAHSLTGTSSADTLHGRGGNDTISAGDGNDYLDGGSGNDVLTGGNGNDIFIVDSASDNLIEYSGEGTDTVFSSVSYTLDTGYRVYVENLTLTGTGNNDATGNSLDNILIGNSGDNSLDGGTGADTMIGGVGNDVYVVDNAGDVVSENANEGIDTIRSSLTTVLGAHFENLILTGSSNIDGTGNSLANTLAGNSGVNTLTGGDGNDTYIVSSSDVVVENASEGTDTVQSDVAYTLGSNLENLTLTGSSSVNGTGNSADNVMIGNSGVNVLSSADGNDTLDGGGNADTLIGGLGDDTYVVDDAGDIISENASEGIDTAMAGISYTLGAYVENLVLTGSSNINGTGSNVANTITGNSGVNTLSGADGNDTLNGGAGADLMLGGTGDDLFFVDDASDVVSENSGEGTDTVQSSVSFTLGADVENLLLTGSSAINGAGNGIANVITGNSGNNSLDGGAGVDTMIGAAGDDTYVVDDVGDVVVENASEGTDTVQSDVTYTLGSNLENLTLTGSSSVNGTGNSADNVMIGNSGVNVLSSADGNDTLDGGGNADTLVGGLGNDTYVIDDAGDIISENASEGTDTAMAGISYTLGADVENLVLTGSSNINGTGSNVANTITGNSGVNTLSGADGNDTLNGGAGADLLLGGTGDDLFFVDNASDIVSENGGEGTDTVQSSVSFTLGADVENLLLTGSSAINGAGNSIANVITGNSGANSLSGGGGADTLDGGTGVDTMSGGTGDDLFIVDHVSDVISENSSEGTDTVQSTVSYTLGSNVENLTLVGTLATSATGNSGINIITGNSANNTLDGSSGADTMLGGLGDDVYIVDNNSDTVVENADEGVDTIRSSVTFTLASYVENLELTGSSNVNGTGNSLANTLTGNSGTNTLSGGDGDDTYVIGSGDVVVETAGNGEDTVISSASFTLGADVEHLLLTGSSNINAVGNSGANTLAGNAGINTLTGGAGNDTYIVGAGDVVVENSSEGTDVVYSSVNYTLSANIEELILTGAESIYGVGNTLDNTITGNSAFNTLDGGAGEDTLIGGLGDDTYVVDDIDDVIIEDSDAGIDTIRSTLSWTLSSNLENLTLLGTSALNGTGNSADNVMMGNSGVNTLTAGDGKDTLNGNAGADTLIGGAGDDLYIVDNIGDVVSEASSSGTDTVSSSISYTLGSHVENLILTGAARLSGTGNSLDNIMTGNSVNNSLSGAGGNDTLDGGAGVDVMMGGSGDDIYFVDRAGDDVIESASEGIDTVYSTVGYLLADNIENLTLTGYASVTARGNSLANILTGNSGANFLYGYAGNDTLIGGQGNDWMSGGAGDDTYIYSSGIDRINEQAGTGTDTLHIAGNVTINDITINDVEIDKVYANTKIVINENIDEILIVYQNLAANTNWAIEKISFDDGFVTTLSDYLTWKWGTNNANSLNGGSGHDVIIGKAGNDILDGGAGNDDIHGGSGNDTLTGGDGSDLMHGGTGNDILRGNDGLDTLYGGTGQDTFEFFAATAYNNIDVIKDFNVSTDHDVLDISDLLSGYNPLTDTLTDFVKIEDGGANSIVSVDRDGTGGTYSWTQIATLTGITGLTNEAALVTSGNLLVA